MMEDCCSDKYTFTDESSEVKITIDDLSVYTGFQYWLDTTDEYDEIKELENETRLLKFKEYYQSQVDAKKFTQLTTEIIRLPAFEDFTPTLNCASFTESEGKLKIDDIIYYTAYQSWVDMERPDFNEELGEFESFKSWLLGQQELKKISQTTTDIKHLPTTECVGGPKGPVETLDFAPIDQDETTQVNATYMSDGVFRVLADNASELNSVINLRDWTSKPPKKLNLPSINDEENKSGLYIKNKIPEFLCVRVDYNSRKYLILATAKEQNDGLFTISTEGNAVTTLNCIALDITEYEPSVDATSVYLQYKEIYDKKSEYYIQNIEVKQGNPFYHCDFEDKTYRFNMSPYELPNLYGAEWINTPGLYVNKETYSTSRWGWKHDEDGVKFNFYLTKKNDETKITHIKNSELTEYTLPNNLADGDYTLTIESVDSRGNISDQSLTSTFTIDTTMPRIDNVDVAYEKTTNGKYKITWSWTGTGDKYNVKLGDGGTYSSRENNSFTSIATVSSDTTFKLFVNAEDNAGNKSSSTIKSITIDVTSPKKPTPTSDTPTNNLRPKWTWPAISDEDTITYQISINGEIVVNSTTSTEYQPTDNLDANKSHTISVRAKDEAGNLSDPGVHTVVIDTTNDETPNPTTTSPTDTLTPTFTWSDFVGNTGETYKFGVRFGKAVTSFEDLTETETTEKSFTPSVNIEVGITYKIYVCSIDKAGNKSEYGQFDVIKNADDPIINTEYEIAKGSVNIEVSSNFNEIVSHGAGINGNYYTWNSATSSFEHKQEVPLDTSTENQDVYEQDKYGQVISKKLSTRYFPMFIKDTLIYQEQSSNDSIGPSYYCTVARWPGEGQYGTGTKCTDTPNLKYLKDGMTKTHYLQEMYFYPANVNYSGYRILKSNGDTLSKETNWKTSFPTTTWIESSTFSSEHNVLICTEFVNTHNIKYNAPLTFSSLTYPFIPSSMPDVYKILRLDDGVSNVQWKECNEQNYSNVSNLGEYILKNYDSSCEQNPFSHAYGLCFYHLEDGKWVKKKNVAYNPEPGGRHEFPKYLQKYSSFTKDNTIHINAISEGGSCLTSAKYIPTTQTYQVVGKTTINTDLYYRYNVYNNALALSESIILVVVQDKEYNSTTMKIYQVDGSTDSHKETWSFTYTDKWIADVSISEDRTNVAVLLTNTEIIDKEFQWEIDIFTTSDDKQKLNYCGNVNLQKTTHIVIGSVHISNNFNSTNDGKSYTNVKRVIYSQSGIKFIDFHSENEIDTTPPSMNINDADTPTSDKEILWSFSVEGHTGDVTGKIKSKPEDSTASVVTISGDTASITADKEGEYSIELTALNEAGNSVTKASNSVTIKNPDDPIINTEYEIANDWNDIEVSSNFNELVSHGTGFNGSYYTWNSATSNYELKQEVPLDTSTTEQNVYSIYDYGKVRSKRLSTSYFPMFIKDTLIYQEKSSDSSIGPSYHCTVGRAPGLGQYGTGTQCSIQTLKYSQNGKTVEYRLYDLYYFQANTDYSGYRILKSNGDTLSKDDNWKTSFPTTTWNESSTFSSEHNVLICTEFVKTYDQKYNAPASSNGTKVYPYIPSSLTNEYKRTDVHYNASNFFWRECVGGYEPAGGNPGSVRIRDHKSSYAQNPFNNAYGLCFYHLEGGKWVKKKNVTYSPEVASQNAFPKFLQKYSSFTKDNTIHINAISSDAKSLISAKYIPNTQTYQIVGITKIDTDLYGKYDSDHVFALSESIILVVVQDKENKSKIIKIYQVDGSTDSHTEIWSFAYTNKTIEDINISEDRTNVCILLKDTENKYEIGIFTVSDDKQKLNYLENANLQETTSIRINSLHISNNFNSTNDGKSYNDVKRIIYSQSGIKFIDFHSENDNVIEYTLEWPVSWDTSESKDIMLPIHTIDFTKGLFVDWGEIGGPDFDYKNYNDATDFNRNGLHTNVKYFSGQRKIVVSGYVTSFIGTPSATRFSEFAESIENFREMVKKVEVKGMSELTDTNSMFAYLSNCSEMNLSRFDTGSVTSMQTMFYKCSSLEKLDLSNFDMRKVKSFRMMFSECNSLIDLNITNWKTDDVEDTSWMFQNCSSLPFIAPASHLDRENAEFILNTSKVTTMSGMFYGCSVLRRLNSTNWDTSQVANMNYMFSFSSGLSFVDLANWDVSGTTYTDRHKNGLNHMFINCNELNNDGVDFSKWCVSKYSEAPTRFITETSNFTEEPNWGQSCE